MEVKPGYRQTDVGLIPKDWNLEILNRCVRTDAPICYGILMPGQFHAGGVPVVKVKDILGGRIDETELLLTHPSIDDAYRRSRLRPGDVLITIRGSTGRVAIVPEALANANITQDTARARIGNNCSSRFVYIAIQSQAVQNQIALHTIGQAVKGINIRDVKNLVIPLPPTIGEQEAIAGALSDADALIESLEQLVAKKRQIKHGAMQELLTGKRRLPGFSCHWDSVHVEDVILKYFCGPSPTCEERNIEGDVEWGVLKTTAITWEQGWDWTKHKALPKIFWNQPEIEVRPGDVLVTKAGPRHRVGVTVWVNDVPNRILVSGKMIGLRPNSGKTVPLMLASAIASKDAQRFLDQRTTGMAESQVNFENSALMQTPIRLPQVEEQTAIASIVNDMDAEIVTLEAKLAKARQIKQGMMQELLTGRIRLI